MVRHWRRDGKRGRKGKERRLKCVLEHADCLMLLQGRRLRVTGSRLFSWFPSSWCDVPSFSSSASTVSFDGWAYEAVCCAAVTARAELCQPEPLLRKTGAAEVIALGNVARLGRLKLFAPVDLRQTSSVRSVTQALSDHI